MIPVLYENDALFVVNKPVGISTVPERDLTRDSLRTVLEKERGAKLFVVHRLDKDASGAIIFAKTADAHRHLSQQFFGRTVHKTYALILHGVIRQPGGEITLPIHQFGSGRMGVDAKRGKKSLTKYTVESRGNNMTRVAAEPLTGRRHQLRVHFYATGNPVAGDPHYGDPVKQKAFPRLMLHAREIRFDDPTRGPVTVTCAEPAEFAACLTALKPV